MQRQEPANSREALACCLSVGAFARGLRAMLPPLVLVMVSRPPTAMVDSRVRDLGPGVLLLSVSCVAANESAII